MLYDPKLIVFTKTRKELLSFFVLRCFIHIPFFGMSDNCKIVSLVNKNIDSLIKAVELIALINIFFCISLTLSSNVMTSFQVYSSFVSLSIVKDVFGPIQCLKPLIKS